MNRHRGGDFDDFLDAEGLLETVTAQAQKQRLALEIQAAMKTRHLTKKGLAARMGTSRSQLDRLIDPQNTKVTLESLEKLATAVGKRLKIELT